MKIIKKLLSSIITTNIILLTILYFTIAPFAKNIINENTKKEAPKIYSAHQTNNDWLEEQKIRIYVDCPNESYEYVIVKLTICDNNNMVISENFLKGIHYGENHNYTLTHYLTAEELLSGYKYTHTVHEYK